MAYPPGDTSESTSRPNSAPYPTYAPFHYQPLVDCAEPGCPKSIRLLELLSGLPDSVISTQLIDSTLTHHRSHELWYEPREGRLQPGHREFAALSYEWGACAVSTREILVNGHAFHIRQNLWNFLWHIRRSRQDSLPTLLWIDSICINQEDIEEKNRQVRLMHRIYAQAKEVLVWLGDSSDHSDEVFQCLQQHCVDDEADGEGIGSKQPVTDRWGHVDAIIRNDARFSRKKSRLAAEFFGRNPRIKTALLKICRRTYWTRAWIIQECLNAKAITLFCGEKSLPHNAFPLLGTLCEHLKQNSSLQHPASTTDSMWTHIQGIDDTQVQADPADRVIELTNRWDIGRHAGLGYLLRSYHGSACSSLHDKVYAFLGLTSEADEFPIDYDIPLFTLFMQTLAFCNTSKHKRNSLNEKLNLDVIDPMRKTCDTIHIAQLLAHDLEIALDPIHGGNLPQDTQAASQQLLSELVTIELDYLGPIQYFWRQSIGDSHNPNAQDCVIIELNMKMYETLASLRPSYGDRAFALRGTPLVLVYHRTLARLHFAGCAILSSYHASTERDPLLACHQSHDDNGNNADLDETDSNPDQGPNHNTPPSILSLVFPPPDPMVRYSFQYGQSLLSKFIRTFILPYLPRALLNLVMIQNPDAAYFASPSIHVPLELAIEIVTMWPIRVRGNEEYCRDLREKERKELACSDMLGTRVVKWSWHWVLDFGVRIWNSAMMM